ncbi:MAG: YggS family pyridoxal phosphate-dependent enzyme [Candidatus Limnocylindria bacterium]
MDDETRSADSIRERHARLLARLRETAAANGHDPNRLHIVAVTKGWPVDLCRAALDAGCEMLGENRVQEAEAKIAALPTADWHLVGHLQSNKARRAVTAFGTIHSVDSVDLLRRIDELVSETEGPTRVLLQVNVSGETAKSGMAPEALSTIPAALPSAARLVGLMTIAPMEATEPEARAVFRRLRELRDGLEQSAGIGLPELSMGMSADADAAAAEGATLVRIGTALFGPRT